MNHVVQNLANTYNVDRSLQNQTIRDLNQNLDRERQTLQQTWQKSPPGSSNFSPTNNGMNTNLALCLQRSSDSVTESCESI